MKNMIKAAVISGLLAAGVAQTYAQTTNSEVTLNIALSGFQQVTTTDQSTNTNPVKATGAISSKSIIKALSGATNGFTTTEVVTTNGTIVTTNEVQTPIIVKTFAANAKLIMFFRDNAQGNGGPTFFVREVIGRTNVDTDVSGFFNASTYGKVGVAKGKLEYDLLSFSFDNGKTGTANGVYVSVNGFMTVNKANLKSKTLGTGTNVVSSFSGTGAGSATLGLNNAIVKGTVSGTGATLDVK
jgi:hypothetical protein